MRLLAPLLGPLLAGVLVVPVVGHAGEAPASVAGVSFTSGSLDDALGRAKARRSLVLVEVFATWCGPCKRQAAEVFHAPAGGELFRDLVAWRVDFDDPAMRPLMERWNILSLPTVLVLRPDGSEVDRIEGYETREAFLAEAARLKKGQDSLPTLEKKLITAADDAERLRLTVEVGHKKLVRGDPAGARLLEGVIIADRGGRAGAAEEALFLLGRYHSRVKRDHATARHIWRELLTRFPSGRYAGTAAWWYAGALHELGDDTLALAVLERRAREKTLDAEDALSRLDALVSFAVEKGVGKELAGIVLDDAEKSGAIPAVAVADLRARLKAASAGGGT